jgi:hypothetical protein
MGIVIRTVFNNQGWAGPCKDPYNDPRCHGCIDGKVNVNNRKPIRVDGNGFCEGDIQHGELWCWEQTLCTEKSFWGNPQGKWGHRAYPGEKIYLVYTEPNGSYTLWGKTEVDRVNNSATPAPELHLKPFKPLPNNKRVRGLSAVILVGKKWGQGSFRYIDADREAFLDASIGGNQPKSSSAEGSMNFSSVAGYVSLTLHLKANVLERLGKIAGTEGREKEDIIREAIAEWLKGRES